MAQIATWQVRWQVLFKSISGIAYTVNIYDWNWQGSITTLTGAAEQFVTHEDDNEDAFTPIRTQSGYISILLDPESRPGDATILEDILPTNDRSRLVRLVHTSGGSTVVDWQGFLKCNMYTQPWEGSTHMVQLPVQSMVATLESIEISPADTSIARMAGLLTHAMNRLLADDVTDANNVAASFMGHVYIQDDGYNMAQSWPLQYIDWKAFLQPQDETEDSVKKTRQFGWNWRDILESICRLWGMTLREKGNSLYFCSYDVYGSFHDYTWAQMVSMAGGQSVSPSSVSITSGTLLTDMALKGADSVQGLAQGKKRVSVILSINTDEMQIKPTEANGNGSTPIDVANMNAMAWGQPHVYVQPHDAISDSVEDDHFDRNNGSGAATQATCQENSVLAANNLAQGAINAWVTGCFPCRWGYKDSAVGYPSMKPGIFLNQRRWVDSTNTPPRDCYMLKTAESYTFAGGYLNIGAAIYNFWLDWIGSGSGKWWFGNTQQADHTMITILLCTLSMGTKEWQATLAGSGENWAYNKGQWANKVVGSPKTFWLIFDGNELRTNKTEDMLVDKTDGYFVPIATADTVDGQLVYTDALMSGAVELKIWSVQYLWSNKSQQPGGWVTSPSRIMSDLEVTYQHRAEVGETNNTANYYRRKTGVAFKGEETVQLSIGTWNANAKGRCFLLGSQNPTNYVEELTYTDGINQTTERPEIHLLGRLVKFYMRTRQWTQAIVEHTMNVLTKRYTYNGRRMVGLDATTNWSRDNKTVKFIEVTGENE